VKNVGPFAVVVVISTVSIRQRRKCNITISIIKIGQIMQGLKGVKSEAAQPTRLSSSFAECGCILRETLLLLQYMMELEFYNCVVQGKLHVTFRLSTTKCRSSSDENKGDVDPMVSVHRRRGEMKGNKKER